MAIFCLATDLADLKNRLSRIVVATTYAGEPVTAGQLGAAGAMAALLKDAFDPNLVQTLEHTPAIIHGGPFANIAHGCNSVAATKLSCKLADYVVTEAGFGADLGAEKFLDIKCRTSGIRPSASVVVATLRALKHHGGCSKEELNIPNPALVRAGLPNLERHIENMRAFGLPVVVAINAFPTDTAEERAEVENLCARMGVPCALSEVFAKGGAGGEALAAELLKILDAQDCPPELHFTYDDALPLKEKIEAVCKKIYRASAVTFSAEANRSLAEFEKMGLRQLPGLHCKNSVFFQRQCQAACGAGGFYGQCAAAAAVCRRRICCGDLRQYHDDARLAQEAGRRADRSG